MCNVLSVSTLFWPLPDVRNCKVRRVLIYRPACVMLLIPPMEDSYSCTRDLFQLFSR